MKRTAILGLVLVLSSLPLLGCAHRPAASGGHVYQTSTITALLEGVYDGDLTLAELSKHGDLGLGTFNDMDGEMVLLDGAFYQVRADGKVYRPSLATRTPLAVVTFFGAAPTQQLNTSLSFDDLRAALDKLLPSSNTPCAFRIDGEFDFVRTRSVPRQSPPYRPLAEITRTQPTFDFHSVRGTLVGFWVPPYMQQLNVPGYHLHFLTADRSAGGHVLDCRPRRVSVRTQELQELTLRLPDTQSFRTAHLAEDRRSELRAVEQAPTGK